MEEAYRLDGGVAAMFYSVKKEDGCYHTGAHILAPTGIMEEPKHNSFFLWKGWACWRAYNECTLGQCEILEKIN